MPKVNERRTRQGDRRFFVRLRVDGIQTSVVFATKPEAEQFARDVDNRGPQRAFEDHIAEEDLALEMSMDEWAKRWLASLTVTPATMVGYRRDWEKRWSPHLGHHKLSQVTREDVVAALKAQKGADKTVANAWGTLATMLKAAVLDRHLERSPALGVKLPKRTSHETTEHRYLTPTELRLVIASTPERYKPLLWMLAGTGMRWGEATALTVADVNLDARTVSVTKAWKRDPDKPGASAWYVGPPKTKKAKRTIALPGEVVGVLRPLVEGRGRNELLFTNRADKAIRHQTFYREHWRKKCTAKVDEPKPRIHDLRHSHVAILIAAGTPLPVIQARLGHEKITTTIDTYGHLMPDLHVAAALAADQALGAPPAADPPELT